MSEHTIDLLWKGPRIGKRGPRPALSLDHVLDAAVRVADTAGLATLSMERVAHELGLTTMALYRYVPGKAEMLALMLDRGVGRPPELKKEPWRRQILRWATALLRVFKAHPWSLQATARLRVMGPNELAWLEAGMRILVDAGLNASEAYTAALALVGQVRTGAQFAVNGDVDPAQWRTTTEKLLEDRDDYPNLKRAIATRRPAKGERALGWVLDGIAAKLDRR